jgi:hypothetical protein
MPDDANMGRPYSGDELDRKLAELMEETSAHGRIKEASAAERAAAAAKAAKAGRKVGRKATRRAHRDGPRGGPGADGSGNSRARIAITVIIVLIVAGGAAFGWQHVTSGRSPGNGNDTQAVKNGPVPPVSAPSVAEPPADPFAGSPADGYADGADGIAVPAAHPVGAFTAGQVGAAYAETKKLLVAATLNPPTLAGGAPDAFANLLLPAERSFFVRGLDKTGLDKQGGSMSTRGWIVSFAPGSTKFVTGVVKTDSTLSARTAAQDGRTVLRIDANELAVYAVEPPRQPADWMRIVVHLDWQVNFARYTDPGGALQPWVTAGDFIAGQRCGIGDGYIHPDFPNGPAPKVSPSGAPVNPYALNVNDTRDVCRSTTGT